MKITISELPIEDWQNFRNLYLKLLANDPDAFADEYEEIASRTEDSWKASLQKKGGKTFVAKDEDVLVGMGRISFYDEHPGVAVLHKLGVVPEYRGMGIARKLVDVREEWAKSQGAEKIRLYVMANRKKTVEFSEKNGYKIVEVSKKDIQRKNGEWIDVVVMEKELR